MIQLPAGSGSLVDRVRSYSANDLVGDLLGSSATAIITLPMALALGVAITATSGDAPGVGALAGLWGAVAVGFFAAVFGGTRGLISAPSAPMAVAMMAVVSHYTLAEAFTVAIMAGLIQIAMGALRLGRFVAYTPYAVISGVVSGVGSIIVVLHVAPFFGSEVASNGLLSAIGAWPQVLQDINVEASALGLITLLVTIFWPARLRKVVPAILAALLIGTVLGVVWLTDAPTIGDVPSGLPSLNWPILSGDFLVNAIESALIMALIGALASLLCCPVADSMTREVSDPNRELIGQGLGNAVAGAIGGLPGGGVMLMTAANIRAGGRSPVAGVVVALLMLAVALGAGSITESIPHTVLAAILIKTGWDVIDWRFLRHIRLLPRGHVAVMLITMIATIFTDLVIAVAIGLILAGLINAARLERLELSDVISVPLLEGSPDDPYVARIGLVQLRGRFTAASANALVRVIAADIEEHEVVIFDFTRTGGLDESAVLVIEQLFNRAHENGTPCVIAGLGGSAESALNSLGVLNDFSADRLADNLTEARELARELLDQEAELV